MILKYGKRTLGKWGAVRIIQRVQDGTPWFSNMIFINTMGRK
jgi:hypothetical protein